MSSRYSFETEEERKSKHEADEAEDARLSELVMPLVDEVMADYRKAHPKDWQDFSFSIQNQTLEVTYRSGGFVFYGGKVDLSLLAREEGTPLGRSRADKSEWIKLAKVLNEVTGLRVVVTNIYKRGKLRDYYGPRPVSAPVSIEWDSHQRLVTLPAKQRD